MANWVSSGRACPCRCVRRLPIADPHRLLSSPSADATPASSMFDSAHKAWVLTYVCALSPPNSAHAPAEILPPLQVWHRTCSLIDEGEGYVCRGQRHT